MARKQTRKAIANEKKVTIEYLIQRIDLLEAELSQKQFDLDQARADAEYWQRESFRHCF